MHRLQEVVRLHRMGLSLRRIAQDLRMSRVTIRRAMEAFAAGEVLEGDPASLPEACALVQVLATVQPPHPPPQQVSTVEAWRGDIERLRERGARPTAIHDWLRLNGNNYTGSLSAVKRLWARLGREAGPEPEDIVIPVETAPGEVGQVDFVYVGMVYDPDAGVLRRCWLFLMTLGYSRHMFGDLVFDQKVSTWIELHVRAFAYLGGAPSVLVPDNLKSGILRAAFGPDDVVLNRSYREMARYHGTRIDPTPPRSPEKKGKVERSGRYVKRNFFATHTSVDIEVDRRALRVWLEEIAAKRRHGVTRRCPGDVFESEEKAALLPLPEKPYEIVVWKEATLHRDAHLQVESAFYSAPWPLVGQRLEVKLVGKSVSIYAGDEHVWTHARVGPGRRQTVEAHLPEHRREYRQRSQGYWLTKASALGEDCRRLAQAIFDSDDVYFPLRRVQAVVRHLEGYPRERANAASRRALHYGCLSYMGVKNILTKGLDLEPLDHEQPTRDWASGSRYARDPAQTTLAFEEEDHAASD